MEVETKKGCEDTLSQVRRIVKKADFKPSCYEEIVNEIFVTCYLGTKNSSQQTNDRAKTLADGIRSHHLSVGIDEAYEGIVNLFEKSTGMRPKYEINGGKPAEDIAL